MLLSHRLILGAGAGYRKNEFRVLGIDRVANGEVDYLLAARTRPGRQYDVSRELRRRVKDTFEQNQIQTGPPGRVFVVETRD
jgi:small-conductance mechanosensitive channel